MALYVALSTASAAADPPTDSAANAATTKTVAGMTINDCQQALDSDQRSERLRAIRTLGAFNADAAAPLAAALGHSDAAVRYLAATSLGRIGGKSLKDAAETLQAMATADDDKQPLSVRMAAAYALCADGQTKQYLPILIDAVSYPQRGTACSAADLIAQIGPPASAATAALEKAYAENKPGVAGGDYHVGGASLNALRKIRGE
ncbi:HEAT repeat domain-containing protein [Stieleria tagensis]|uniref:HEAT repeat domain-containing protein n=1 Tax=Stieleria tagensis TaxID=2956795 RepID=UPI00209A68E5|nr:HEAT repeat domain-containing protein [Stieleria tagensis]